MITTLATPGVADLGGLASTLASWQVDGGPVQLHPGDLGWYSLRGAEQTAASLRTWSRDGTVLALGLLDGPDPLLRMAFDPAAGGDEDLARQVAVDLADPEGGVLGEGEAIVEARGATALECLLMADGWGHDEPWIPFHLDLTDPVEAIDLRIEDVDDTGAEDWVAVHWSAFKGTPMSDQLRHEVAGWWRTMHAGPFGERGRSLTMYDAHGDAVAVVGVWTAGPGRPGLVEPMGVHADHRGRGHGVAACRAAAAALRALGSSSAVVAAEASNTGAVAAYTAAGFTAHPPVADLVRG